MSRRAWGRGGREFRFYDLPSRGAKDFGHSIQSSGVHTLAPAKARGVRGSSADAGMNEQFAPAPRLLFWWRCHVWSSVLIHAGLASIIRSAINALVATSA